jgi:parallel beta-helix repeat protein
VARPVSIGAQNPQKKWGVFAVVQPGAESTISYARFDGGSDAHIAGAFLSGMVDVYEGDATIEHSVFTRAKGDDSLNVKKGNVLLQNNLFQDNSADGADLDFASGFIQNNTFVNNGNDGIDLSGSHELRIEDNTIIGSGDKCISVGEQSVVTVTRTRMARCKGTGIAVKDLSRAFVKESTIVNNAVGVELYKKKDFFGGGTLEITNSLVWGNARMLQKDDQSSLTITYSDVQDSFKGEGNITVEPLFTNPELNDYSLKDATANDPIRALWNQEK